MIGSLDIIEAVMNVFRRELSLDICQYHTAVAVILSIS